MNIADTMDLVAESDVRTPEFDGQTYHFVTIDSLAEEEDILYLAELMQESLIQSGE